MGVQRVQIRLIKKVFKVLDAQVGQFLPKCKCLVCRDIVMQEQDTLLKLPKAFYLQNVFQLHKKRCVIQRVVGLALWKIISEEDAVLIAPKIRGENISSGFFANGIFWME